MIRAALDSDQPDVLLSHAHTFPIALTYSDLIGDPKAFQDRLGPACELVLIDRGLGDPSGLASVADIENGALKAPDLPGWYDRKHAAGVRFLTAYANRSNLADVDAALGPRHAYRWIATLDGTAAIATFMPLRTPALVQILNAAMVGLHADLSLIFEDGWHPSPVPALLKRHSAELLASAHRTAADALAVDTIARRL